jgi:NAD(P)-dependent dehydrogenase (short-subunit alcohol dehydrogenase family)
MKTAIITGANGSVGTVLTRTFLERGWRIYGVCKDKIEIVELLKLKFAAFHTTFTVSACDLASVLSVQHFLATLNLSCIDAVIHCAGGIQAGTTIDATTPPVVQDMIELNYITTFNLLRATIPLLNTNGGAILTIGARAAVQAEAGKSAYAASKAALIALTLTAAEEGKSHGVRANCIVPNVVDTPANRTWGTAADIAQWVTPESIAEAAWMLCSDSGKGISGAVIPMMGMG